MKDGPWHLEMQPRDGMHTEPLSLVPLVFSPLYSSARAKAQINSIWAGRGPLLSGCISNSQYIWDSTITGFFPQNQNTVNV